MTNNYRPICLNIQFSKILEKLFFSRLLSFCDFHNIISSSQFGFRKGLSALHAIESLQKAIIDSLISNKYCVGLFIDLKKAFDTVNHEILLKKLDFYGIRGLPSTFDFIQAYNKYNYMNNSLMSYGPKLWNELNIDKKNEYLFPFSVIIFLIIF